MTATTAPLVYQGFIAKALGGKDDEAREFVEAQGYKTYPRGKSPRTWAMAAHDWHAIATAVGVVTPAVAVASVEEAAELANQQLGHLARPAFRRQSRGSRSPSA